MSGEVYRSPGGEVELRCGDWREVLSDVAECDTVITDPPYSERVVLGYRSGSDPNLAKGTYNIPYLSRSEAGAVELANWCAGHVRHWAIVFNDHVGARWLADAFAGIGWYVFAPIPWCKTDPPPRMNGDGPCSATEWITIARPRRKMPSDRMGSRPGWYTGPSASASRFGQKPIVTGQKSLALMRSIVRDYTLPGDLVVDPFGGGATTLLAAAVEDRRVIGAELDPKTYAKAVRRLSDGWTPRLVLPDRKMRQEKML